MEAIVKSASPASPSRSQSGGVAAAKESGQQQVAFDFHFHSDFHLGSGLVSST